MNNCEPAKILTVILIAINCYMSCGAALRKTPKVYNALITTDDNLTSSRAYPVIQPTIHETGIAHFPFGPYNPYGFYSPPALRFGPGIAPGLISREQQLPYPLQQSQLTPQHPQIPNFQGYPQSQNFPPPHQLPPSAPGLEQQPQAEQPIENKNVPKSEPPSGPSPSAMQQIPNYMPVQENRPHQMMPTEKQLVPLNEFGPPPSLIPLSNFGTRIGNPLNLPPYAYNNYPLIYEPSNGYPDQYLPAYDFFPHHTFSMRPPSLPPKKSTPTTAATEVNVPASKPISKTDVESPKKEEEPVPESTEMTFPSFESIRNGVESKNSAVPDVPPPPIPSGGKSTEA